ncbi:MAG: MBL fold metallo-hydrolase [Candidatus Woesearchaeota archaeon]
MMLTWLGHATFKIKTKDGKRIYIDPYVEPHAGLWSRLEPAELVLISHWHPDHASIETINKIRLDNTTIYGTREAAAEIDGCMQLVAGQEISLGWVVVKAIPAYTPRRPSHRLAGFVVGFVLELENKRIYYASDTEVIPEMQALGKIDLAIFPIGGTYTMSAIEAARATELIKPSIAIPSHWGKLEGTIDDAERFKELVEARLETKVIVMAEGESIEV